MRAQKNGAASWRFKDDEGNEAQPEEVLGDQFFDRQIVVSVPAPQAKEPLERIGNAIDSGQQTVILTIPDELAETVELLVRESAAFEGVEILSFRDGRASGFKSDPVLNMNRLKRTYEEAEKEGVPLSHVERYHGYHLRAAKTAALVTQPESAAASTK